MERQQRQIVVQLALILSVFTSFRGKRRSRPDAIDDSAYPAVADAGPESSQAWIKLNSTPYPSTSYQNRDRLTIKIQLRGQVG